MITEIKCVMCDELATWMRYTQFAGDHPFCDKHAYDEMGKDSNDGDWESLDDVLQETKRETNSLEN